MPCFRAYAQADRNWGFSKLSITLSYVSISDKLPLGMKSRHAESRLLFFASWSLRLRCASAMKLSSPRDMMFLSFGAKVTGEDNPHHYICHATIAENKGYSEDGCKFQGMYEYFWMHWMKVLSVFQSRVFL